MESKSGTNTGSPIVKAGVKDQRYSIGAIAQAAGVSTQTIRLWEKRGEISATRSQGGQRLFAADALKRAAELAAQSKRLRVTSNSAKPGTDTAGLASTGM